MSIIMLAIDDLIVWFSDIENNGLKYRYGIIGKQINFVHDESFRTKIMVLIIKLNAI